MTNVFFAGLITFVLHLQHDKSLFIASLTSQVVAQILNFIVPPVLSDRIIDQSITIDNSVGHQFGLVREYCIHLTSSLSSEQPTVVLQALKSLALVFSKCREHQEMLWKHVMDLLEVLTNGDDDLLTQPILAVLQTAAG